MIKTFAHKGLEQYFFKGTKKGIQPHHSKKLDLILAALESAKEAENLNIPGWVFHPLKNLGANVYSVRVDGNYRVTFTFINGNAENVNYLDYH